MPRGLDSSITTELNQTTFAAPIYWIRIRRKDGSYLRFGERAVTFDDGFGSQAFSARLVSVSDFQFSADQAGPITITLANVDGQITTYDRAESFAGETCELIA